MKSASALKKSYMLLQLEGIVGSNTSELTGKRNSIFRRTTPAHIIELAEASFMNIFGQHKILYKIMILLAI